MGTFDDESSIEGTIGVPRRGGKAPEPAKSPDPVKAPEPARPPGPKARSPFDDPMELPPAALSLPAQTPFPQAVKPFWNEVEGSEHYGTIALPRNAGNRPRTPAPNPPRGGAAPPPTPRPATPPSTPPVPERPGPRSAVPRPVPPPREPEAPEVDWGLSQVHDLGEGTLWKPRTPTPPTPPPPPSQPQSPPGLPDHDEGVNPGWTVYVQDPFKEQLYKTPGNQPQDEFAQPDSGLPQGRSNAPTGRAQPLPQPRPRPQPQPQPQPPQPAAPEPPGSPWSQSVPPRQAAPQDLRPSPAPVKPRTPWPSTPETSSPDASMGDEGGRTRRISVEPVTGARRSMMMVQHISGNDWHNLEPLRPTGQSIGRGSFRPDHPLARFLAEDHLRLVVENDQVYAEEGQTINGVYRIVTRGRPIELTPGLRFQVGQHVIEFSRATPAKAVETFTGADGEVFRSLSLQPLAYLDFLGGNGKPTTRVPLLKADGVVIGRDAKHAEIVLHGDEWASRAHVKITARDGTFLLEDLGSLNGTFVRISGRVALRVGRHDVQDSSDVLLIGGILVRVVET